jgi:VanZ family protein
MTRLRSWLPTLLFVAFAIFIALVIRAANTGQGERYWSFLDAIPFGDKLGHVILMGILCFLLNLALHCRTVTIRKSPILLGTLLVSLFVIVEEISQLFLQYRSFDLGDLLADAIGIALASGLAVSVSNRNQ